MSVLVSKRAKSKLEVFVCANDIHKMLIELIQRDFGVRDVDQVVRIRYAYGKDPVENFPKYRELMRKSKDRIDEAAALLTTIFELPTPSTQRLCTNMNSGEIIKTTRLLTVKPSSRNSSMLWKFLRSTSISTAGTSPLSTEKSD